MAYQLWGALRRSQAPDGARRKTGAAILALAICAGLGACASDPGWPTMGKISDMSNVMTPEQRQKALQDLQKSDTSPSSTATGSQAKQGQ